MSVTVMARLFHSYSLALYTRRKSCSLGISRKLNNLIVINNFEAGYKINSVMFSMFDSYFQHLIEPEHSGRRVVDDWNFSINRLIQLDEWD